MKQNFKRIFIAAALLFGAHSISFAQSNTETVPPSAPPPPTHEAQPATEIQTLNPSDLNELYLQLLNTTDRVQQLQKKFSTPLMKKLLEILSDQKIITPLLERVEELNYKRLIIYQIVVFFLYLLFKSWFTSQKMHWFKKALGSLTFTLAYAAIASYGIPLLFLGSPFHQICKRVFLGLISQTQYAHFFI